MSELNAETLDFVGQIAVSVWIGRLSDDAAREALDAYAAACRQAELPPRTALREALFTEYRHRREGQELCS
jgi:hypothetical protein